MASALDELNTRVGEIQADLKFAVLAFQLRPRVAEILLWEAQGEILELAKQFINAKSSRPEGVYGPLLVRLLAAFERYLRMLVAQSVEARSTSSKLFEELSHGMTSRNMIFTGRILAAIGSPRDHLSLNVDSLINNLATCKKGSSSFRLNTAAFSATVVGVSPEMVQKALEAVDVEGCWDGVGRHNALARILGTRGARATGERARERLKELWRWRNHLAHGGDEEIAVSEPQLREAIEFILCFSAALNDVVEEHLGSAWPSGSGGRVAGAKDGTSCCDCRPKVLDIQVQNPKCEALMPGRLIISLTYVFLGTVTLAGCSPAARQRTATAVSSAAAGAAGSAPRPAKLMIFGGLDHKTYLGCLSCGQYATDSVLNPYGTHGSPYSQESIWNHYSEYGSAYSTYGACNAYATDPPVIVDQDGIYYGRLTLNQYHPERGAGVKYYNWLSETVCK